uniref:Uncharacterized protein n=1 Tax=Oryza brachyantha TaxID=4533 RepID=J3MCV5_ORYBR
MICPVLNAIAGAYSENLPVICVIGGANSNDYATLAFLVKPALVAGPKLCVVQGCWGLRRPRCRAASGYAVGRWPPCRPPRPGLVLETLPTATTDLGGGGARGAVWPARPGKRSVYLTECVPLWGCACRDAEMEGACAVVPRFADVLDFDATVLRLPAH